MINPKKIEIECFFSLLFYKYIIKINILRIYWQILLGVSVSMEDGTS